MKKYLPDLKQFWISDYKKINICVCQSTRSSCLLCLFSLFSWPICLPVFSLILTHIFFIFYFFSVWSVYLSLYLLPELTGLSYVFAFNSRWTMPILSFRWKSMGPYTRWEPRNIRFVSVSLSVLFLIECSFL